MKKILFLGDHKNLFGKLKDWINENSEEYQVVEQRIVNKETGRPFNDEEVEPDIIFCIYSGFSPSHNFWKGVKKKDTTKVIRYGRWDKVMLDEFYIDHDHFATMAVEESKFVPDGKFSLLPLPIDISEIPQAELNADRPLKIMQGYMPMRKNKQTYLIKDVCNELGIEFEGVTGLSKEEFFNKVKDEAFVLVDQFWRGEIGMVSWEMMAMGIPVICYVSEETENAFTEVFGSFPPIINLDVSQPITEDMNIQERDKLARPALKSILQNLTKEDLILIGQASKKWMEENYSKEKVIQLYTNFFNKF